MKKQAFIKNSRNVLSAFLAGILFFIILTESLSLGEDKKVIKVPLKVNVLKGVSVSDDTIKQIVKGINKIYKDDGVNVAMEFDPNNPNSIKRNVSDGGNEDGKIQKVEEPNLDEKGLNEVKGGGIKIYLTKEIRDDNDNLGLAPHDANGSTTAKPVAYVKIPVDTTETGSHTAAHEVSHILTLGPAHPIDPNTVADSTWHHPTDTNNLEYKSLYRRDPSGKLVLTGTKLTPMQRKEIEDGAARIGKSKTVTKDSNNPAVPPKVTPSPVRRWRWIDDMNDAIYPYNNLGAGFLFSAAPYTQLDFDLLFEGLFTNPQQTNSKIWAYFNTDNNVMTGLSYYGIAGVDKYIELDLDFPPNYIHKGIVWGKVYSSDVGSPYTMIGPGTVGTIRKVIDTKDVNHPSYVDDYVDGIHISIPMSCLGPLADQVPMLIRCYDANTGDGDMTSFVWQVVDHNEPVFELVNTRVKPCERLAVQGHNFTPYSQVKIYLDDSALGTTVANYQGVIEANFPMPHGLAFTDYFVTARDVSGRYDFSMVEYTNNAADLSLNGKVDFTDFAIFASHWLDCCQ